VGCGRMISKRDPAVCPSRLQQGEPPFLSCSATPTPIFPLLPSFSPFPPRTHAVTMQAKSASVPFLSQPKNLDGSMAGDVGFDPLGMSTYIDLKWLREAELKHGRICMLATTGILVQEVVRLPGEQFSAKVNPPLPLSPLPSLPRNQDCTSREKKAPHDQLTASRWSSSPRQKNAISRQLG